MGNFKPAQIVLLLLASSLHAEYQAPTFPFAPAAGEEGTTAIAYNDTRIQAWATRVASVEYGEDVAVEWRQPPASLGPTGLVAPDFLVLGRGGSVVLEFDSLIRDGEGPDFIVFENAFSDTFLELAYVEVSSDGTQFVRFPGYSYTAGPVGAFEQVDPTFVHGFGGKYRMGFGTPFDLAELRAAYEAILAGYDGFSDTYRSHLMAGFPGIDPDNIRYVRILDIPGDGSSLDCEGEAIYDPYPTLITAGFDLDAVGVLNPVEAGVLTFARWCSDRGLVPDPFSDSDRDDWSQYMEYILGSDPEDPESRPVIEVQVSRVDESLFLHEFTWLRIQGAETLPLVRTKAGAGEWEFYSGRPELAGNSMVGGVPLVRERIKIPTTSEMILLQVAADPPQYGP
jgi:hypothetical protein